MFSNILLILSVFFVVFCLIEILTERKHKERLINTTTLLQLRIKIFCHLSLHKLILFLRSNTERRCYVSPSINDDCWFSVWGKSLRIVGWLVMFIGAVSCWMFWNYNVKTHVKEHVSHHLMNNKRPLSPVYMWIFTILKVKQYEYLNIVLNEILFG